MATEKEDNIEEKKQIKPIDIADYKARIMAKIVNHTPMNLIRLIDNLADKDAIRIVPEGKQRNPVNVTLEVLYKLKYKWHGYTDWDTFIDELSLWGASWETYSKYFFAYKRKGVVDFIKGQGIKWTGSE